MLVQPSARPDPYAAVLEALKVRGCRVWPRRPGAARAQCPSHADRKPSLSVTAKADTVLIHCFAGCKPQTVLSALGLTWPALFAGPKTQAPADRIVSVYRYADLHGELIAEKVRVEPKRFSWRRREPSNPAGYRSGTAGAELPVYRLPDLIDAKHVLIAEGEKAVDRLRELRFVATCPPAGASAWQDRWSDQIWRCGAVLVVVLADADEPGRKHAERVAGVCHGYRASVDVEACAALWPTEPDDAELEVKLLELPGLPAGGDVVDWLDGGHSAGELRALIDATPIWSPDWKARERRERKRRQNADRQRRFRQRRRDERQRGNA